MKLFSTCCSLLAGVLFFGGCCGCESALRTLPGPRAQISFSADTLASQGFESVTIPAKENIDFVSGPYEWFGAAKGADGPCVMEGLLENPVKSAGSVMLWLILDKDYKSSKDVEEIAEKILTIDGIGAISFFTKEPIDNCVSMEFRWDESLEGIDNIRMLLPELPGRQWVHLGFVWDADAGIFNGYVNGTSFKVPGTTVPAWEMPESKKLSLQLGKLPIADVRFYDRVLSSDEFKTITGERHVGKIDRLLGAAELGDLDVEALKGNLIYENKLTNADDIAGWVLEGPGEISFANGWMKMLSPNQQGHIVHWCDKDFPSDFVAQWDYQLQSEYGLSIVFFSAKSIHGTSIFDPAIEKRTGNYRGYVKGDINCYGVSYQANTEFNPGRQTSNLRKNKGFYLGANGPIGIRPGSKDAHKITLIKQGNHIQMAVDGRKIIDFVDKPEMFGPALGQGKIGFRQMRWTIARYRNFRVYEISK